MAMVLIVEDSQTDQAIFAGCLREEGYGILQAGSSEEALAQLAKHRPDAVVLDVVLPDRSGFELCRQLKRDLHTQAIPVVMCSTKGGNMDRFWGLKQGADAYLAKPIDHEEFLKTVRGLLQR